MRVMRLNVPKNVSAETPIWEMTLSKKARVYPKVVSAFRQHFRQSIPVYESMTERQTPLGWLYHNLSQDQAIFLMLPGVSRAQDEYDCD